MAEMDRRPRATGRAAAIGTRRATELGARLGDRLAAGLATLCELLGAEAEAGRLAPWLPIAFGSGILLYLAAPAEPSLAAPPVALALLAAVTWGSRDRPGAFAAALGVATIAAEFSAATLRASYVAHLVLVRPTATLTLKGFVESCDATERAERVVLRIIGKEARGADRVPLRVRLAVRRGLAPAVGEHAELKARLPAVSRPGMAGAATTTRLAPTSSALAAPDTCSGRPKAAPAPTEIPLDIGFFAAIEGLRRIMDTRIRASLPGEVGTVATALVTGVRDFISPEVWNRRGVVGVPDHGALTGNATAAHFHGPADRDKNAAVVVPITGSLVSSIEGSATLTEAQAADFIVGRWYFNIHTAAHGPGEIRGQMLKGM